jgi:hypothetical protein
MHEWKGREGKGIWKGRGEGEDASLTREALIPDDWRPSAATTGKAKALGLTDDDIAKAIAKFTANHRGKGATARRTTAAPPASRRSRTSGAKPRTPRSLRLRCRCRCVIVSPKPQRWQPK